MFGEGMEAISVNNIWQRVQHVIIKSHGSGTGVDVFNIIILLYIKDIFSGGK